MSNAELKKSEIENIIALRNNGKTLKEIANIYGVSINKIFMIVGKKSKNKIRNSLNASFGVAVNIQFSTIECPQCNFLFAVPKTFNSSWQKSGISFSCPSCFEVVWYDDNNTVTAGDAGRKR